MNPKLLAAIKPIIRNGLETMTIERGRYPVRLRLVAFIAAEMKFKHGEDRRLLQRCVDDDYALLELVNHFLLRKLRTNAYKMEEGQEPLAEQPGCEDLDSLTDEFMILLDSLPLRYAFSFPLPAGTLQVFGDGASVEIAPNLRVAYQSDALESEFPLTTGDKKLDEAWLGPMNLLFIGQVAKFSPDTIQIFDEGYVGSWGSTMPSKRASQRYLSVLGLCIAAGLFKAVPNFENAKAIQRYLVHEHVDGWVPIDRLELETNSRSFVSSLVLNPAFDQGSQQHRDCLFGVIHDLRVIFRDEEANHRLIRAAEWYFGALAGSDPVLQFVQMMVVLEIIYGDEAPNDKISLGELLRNRCAYAIGVTAEDRDSIAKSFPEIYTVRSKIVHTGKNRLSLSERGLYSKLSEYCRRSIAHEIVLIARDDAAREERNRRSLIQ
jgi:hypothetical protein